MDSLATRVPSLLTILLIFFDTQVTAQEGPGIVITHPGQDVELLCTVTVTDSTSQTTGWLVNNEGPYRINSLRNGILTGHTATLDSANLIVENIMMNDVRNDSEYRCVIVPTQGVVTLADIIDENDPTILYVAGAPAMVPDVTVDENTININENSVTLTLSWEEPFNNLDLIVNYTVSCSGDVTCPSNFTTTDNTTRSYTTSLIPMTNYTFSVVATNSIGSGEASVLMITTPPSENIVTSNPIVTTTNTASITMSNMTTTTTTAVTTTSTTTTANTSSSGNGNGDKSTMIIVIVIVVLILLYCYLMILFVYCYRRKERDYQYKEFCDEPKCLVKLIILGVFTFGISILVWYIYVKCKDDDDGLGPKGIKFFFDHDEAVTPYAVSPQALSEGKHTTTKAEALQNRYDASDNPISLVVPGANNNLQSASTTADRRNSAPQKTTAADCARIHAEANKRSSVPYMTTPSGIRYALSDKVSAKDNDASSDTTEDQGIRYAELDQLSSCVNAVSGNPSIQYTEVL